MPSSARGREGKLWFRSAGQLSQEGAMRTHKNTMRVCVCVCVCVRVCASVCACADVDSSQESCQLALPLSLPPPLSVSLSLTLQRVVYKDGRDNIEGEKKPIYIYKCIYK